MHIAEIEKSTPGQGQVVVRVHAAGVNGIDWKVREGLVRNAFPFPLPIVLGAKMALIVDGVFATAGTADLDYVQSLGADHVINYQSQRFESIAQNIDLVLDYVGGEVMDHSWQVLAQDGVIVGTSPPDILLRTPVNRRGLWFINKPGPELLERLAHEVANKTLQSRVSDVISFTDIPNAIERNRTVSHTGKVVADFTR
jgi:NADPH:quinone reductase-like Zn-dependent oxidoreductase